MNDEKIILSRLSDYIVKAVKTERPVYTDFLNPVEQSLAMDVLDKNKDVIYTVFGGYENSERRMIGIQSVFLDAAPDFSRIKAVRVDFDGFNLKWLEHRSILGTVLGLGCDRRMIGDIIIKEQSAYIFMVDNTAVFAAQNLISVGRATVSATVIDPSKIRITGETGKTKRLTVSGLRIDAVLSGALNLSRGKATELIQAEKVFLNWRLVKKSTKVLTEGDTISVRGMGRVVLKTIGNKSHKGRTWIELETFL